MDKGALWATVRPWGRTESDTAERLTHTDNGLFYVKNTSNVFSS